jgi:hypothetical protein
MITEILTIEDVKQFAKQLIAEGLSFHPDDNFTDYINFSTNEPSYNTQEADLRNELMNQCFEICENDGVDIYEIMLEVMNSELNLNNNSQSHSS